MKRALSVLVAAVLLAALVPFPSVAAGQSYTLMVYLCGTDLESEGGLASDDLKEMIASGVSENGGVTVYVQTGGTKNWTMKAIKDKEAQRWKLTAKGLEKLEDLGREDMGSGATFTDFLDYGLTNFPADRYGLILWDHGAGATDGVCYDEITGESLDMKEIYAAFQQVSQNANYRKFSMVGFDACLMADYEMAVHLQPFADVMIASEETEPGEGWAYKGWLPKLVKNPGIDMQELGKSIVDSFVRSVSSGSDEFGTLSVLDLTRLDGLKSAIEAMGQSLAGAIDAGDFNAISRIRQKARSFGETSDSASDMIDLGVFADMYERYDEAGAASLRDALAAVVVHNGFTRNLSDISGLAVLVPYSTREEASGYMQVYDALNLMPSYTAFVRSFLSKMGAGTYTFGSAEITEQPVEEATVDWFSQFSSNPDSYYDNYESLWGGSSDSGDNGAASGGTSAGSGNSGAVADAGNSNSSSTDAGSGALGSQGAQGTQGTQGAPGAEDNFSIDGFINSLFGSDGANLDTGAIGYEDLWGAGGTGSDTVSSGSFADLWSDTPQTEATTVQVTGSDGETYAVANPFANAAGDYAYTVTLSDEDMNHLATAEANLLMDMSDPDFEFYVDLGTTHNVIIDWNQNKIYGLFDGTWPTLAGQMVQIIDQVANENYVRSLIPATLNGKETYLLVVFDETNPGGKVVGATEGYNENGQPVRGYEELKEGDVVVPQYDTIYWDAEGKQLSDTYLGDPITVGAGGALEFGYAPVESGAYSYGFCLNDVFGGYQYTDFASLKY